MLRFIPMIFFSNYTHDNDNDDEDDNHHYFFIDSKIYIVNKKELNVLHIFFFSPFFFCSRYFYIYFKFI